MTWELTPELGETICKLIVSGKSFRAISRMEGMPSRDTIMRWERDNKKFAANVAHAREAKNEDDIEELEEINEQLRQGLIDPTVAREISNNKKWVASRLLPKYKDSTQIKHADANGDKIDMVSLVKSLDGTSAGLPKISG